MGSPPCGELGVPRPAPLRPALPCGERGGSPPCPTPQNWSQLRGSGGARGKVTFSNLFKTGNWWWNNIATLKMPNPACKQDKQETQYNTESYSCGLLLRESKKWKYLQLNPLFCQQGFQLCSPKFVNLWNSSSMSQISSLVLLLLMAILIVKMMMMVNWWWLWLRSRLWILSIFGELHF